MVRLGKIDRVIIIIPSGYSNVEVIKTLTSHISETDIKVEFQSSDSKLLNDEVYLAIPEQGVIFKSNVALEVMEQYKLSYKEDQEKIFSLNEEESRRFLENVQAIKSEEQDIDFGAEDDKNIMDYD